MTGPHQVLVLFDTAHRLHRDGWPYALVRGKDHKLAADLLESYSLEQLERLVDHFFRIEDDFIAKAGYSFGVFKACVPKILADYQRQVRQTAIDTMRREKAAQDAEAMANWRAMSCEERARVLQGD